jgi:hypothetical protein
LVPKGSIFEGVRAILKSFIQSSTLFVFLKNE